jgi:hypothetical protein
LKQVFISSAFVFYAIYYYKYIIGHALPKPVLSELGRWWRKEDGTPYFFS